MHRPPWRIRRALREERAFRVDDVPYDLPTGGRGHANVAALPLIDGKSSMGAVVIFEDITRFVKLAEQALRGQVPRPNPNPSAARRPPIPKVQVENPKKVTL